jgi:small subunit ribosomal protein S6
MHNYEMVIIIHPDLDDEAINQTLDKIKDWIAKSGGSIDSIDNWGKRHLAYEIQKQNEGIYYLLNLVTPAESIVDLEKNLRILEPVMRHMIVAKPSA